jgi:Domain of unknown function (DUF3883)
VAEPPPKPERRGRHVDYGVLQEENRRRGTLGEQLVVDYERNRLIQAGRADLAGRVVWTASVAGDGLGYDVQSFETSGGVVYIEVKTTAYGPETPFYISAAELEFARRAMPRHRLYRVFDVLARPRFFMI